MPNIESSVGSSVENHAGGYHYVPGIPPYSAGVRAAPGHRIVRVTVGAPTAWSDGFALIDGVLAEEGRPSQALCAVELRCPRPHSFDGFGSFNDDYRRALTDRDILLADGTNPVARTNVAPARGAGSETELYAFSYTVLAESVTAADVHPSFVVAGAGDLHDQADLRPEAIVGGSSPWSESGPARAEAVLDVIQARMAGLGLWWLDTDSVVVYSVERIDEVVESTILPRLGAAARRGIHWHHARPPVEGLRFEMDARGGVIERRL